MKSLVVVKSLIEQTLSQNEYELCQIYDIIDSIEKAKITIDESYFAEDKDEQTIKRLSYYSSYLYTKANLLEEENSVLLKDNDFIVVENGLYTLNSSYSYDELYSFINRYKDYFSLADLAELFVVVKHIKMQQVIETTEKETVEEPELHIEEETKEEEIDLSQEIETVPEEKVSLSSKEIIISFLEILSSETEIDENETYELIQNAYKKCKSFQDSSLYSFFTDNLSIYESYKNSNDQNNLAMWIKVSLPEYSDCANFEFFDRVIKYIDMCDKFLKDYFDLTSLQNKDDVLEFYPLFQISGTITSPNFMRELEFDFVKTKSFEVKGNDVTRSRKNIVFYTPKSLKSGVGYFDDLKPFVESLSTNDWDAIFSSFEPNSILSVDTKSFRDFTHDDYLSIASEFELHDITRVLGSRDKIIEENKKRLMDYYGANEMEVISIHNIFTGPHGGAGGGRNQSIGQYGYTPYYSQLKFFSILTKNETWTDDEFNYVCQIANFSMEITKCIIDGKKDELNNLSDKLLKVLNSNVPSKEKNGGKSNDRKIN